MSPQAEHEGHDHFSDLQEEQDTIDLSDGALDAKIALNLSTEQQEELRKTYIEKLNKVIARLRRTHEQIDRQKDAGHETWPKWQREIRGVEQGLLSTLSDLNEKYGDAEYGNILVSAADQFNRDLEEAAQKISFQDEALNPNEGSESQRVSQHLSVLLGNVIDTSSESGKRTLEAYNREYRTHAHDMPIDEAASLLRDLRLMREQLSKPITAFEHTTLIGLIVQGRESGLLQIKTLLCRERVAKIMPELEEIEKRLPVLENRIAREKAFITELTEQKENLFAWAAGERTNRDAMIAQHASAITRLTAEAEALVARHSELTAQLGRTQAELLLTQNRIGQRGDRSQADRDLLTNALALPPEARNDAKMREALDAALDRLRSTGTLDNVLSKAEIKRLRSDEESAVETALDEYRDALPAVQIATQLEHARESGSAPFTIESCNPATMVPEEYREKARQSKHVHIKAEGWGVRGMRTIRTGDGREFPGIVLSKGAKAKLHNVPGGYTPVLLRIPPPHRPLPQPKIEGAGPRVGNARRHRDIQYTFTFEEHKRSMLMKEDIAFAKTEIGAGREITVQKESESASIREDDLQRAEESGNQLQAALLEHPAVRTLERGGREMLSAFSPLQKMLQAGMEGHKEEGFVETTRAHAADLLEAYRKSGVEHRLTEIWDLVTELDALPKSAINDEVSEWIDGLQQQLDVITIMVRSNAVEELCERIASDAFDTDGFWKWMRTNGVIMASAIGVAVLAVLAIPTGGATGVGAVALMSGLSATGAYVGSEIGKGIVSVYDDGIRSDLQRLMREEIDMADYLGSMTQQIGTGFVTSFILIGAGSYLGNAARTVAAKGTARYGPKEVMARVVTKTAKELGRIDEALERLPLGRNQMARFARETMQEFYEEGGEGSFEWMATSADQAGNEIAARILKGCAFVFTVLNCAKGPGLTMGSAFGVTMDSMEKIGDDLARLNFSYNGSVEDLKKDLMASGIGELSIEENGTVRVTEKRDGVTVVREYAPTSEPEFVRTIRGQSQRGDGTSALDAYGLKFEGEGQYSAVALDPKGQLTLTEYLKEQGALVRRQPDGTLVVRHGGEEVRVAIKSQTTRDPKVRLRNVAAKITPPNSASQNTSQQSVVPGTEVTVSNSPDSDLIGTWIHVTEQEGMVVLRNPDTQRMIRVPKSILGKSKISVAPPAYVSIEIDGKIHSNWFIKGKTEDGRYILGDGTHTTYAVMRSDGCFVEQKHERKTLPSTEEELYAELEAKGIQNPARKLAAYKSLRRALMNSSPLTDDERSFTRGGSKKGLNRSRALMEDEVRSIEEEFHRAGISSVTNVLKVIRSLPKDTLPTPPSEGNTPPSTPPIDDDFLLEPEGTPEYEARYRKEAEATCNAYAAKAGKSLGIPKEHIPLIHFVVTEEGYLGAYDVSTHTILLNEEYLSTADFRQLRDGSMNNKGSMGLQNTILHEMEHARRALLRTSLGEENARALLKEATLHKVGNDALSLREHFGDISWHTPAIRSDLVAAMNDILELGILPTRKEFSKSDIVRRHQLNDGQTMQVFTYLSKQFHLHEWNMKSAILPPEIQKRLKVQPEFEGNNLKKLEAALQNTIAQGKPPQVEAAKKKLIRLRRAILATKQVADLTESTASLRLLKENKQYYLSPEEVHARIAPFQEQLRAAQSALTTLPPEALQQKKDSLQTTIESLQHNITALTYFRKLAVMMQLTDTSDTHSRQYDRNRSIMRDLANKLQSVPLLQSSQTDDERTIILHHVRDFLEGKPGAVKNANNLAQFGASNVEDVYNAFSRNEARLAMNAGVNNSDQEFESIKEGASAKAQEREASETRNVTERLANVMFMVPEVEQPKSLEAMQDARKFFLDGFGIEADKEGYLDCSELSDEQLQKLHEWRNDWGDAKADMPTEDAFYKKMLLSVSLWRQSDGKDTQYLHGKGAGTEVALQGVIQEREKRSVEFSYRSHSDFELYGVADDAEGLRGQFKRVFGGSERFSSMKGFPGVPREHLLATAETVDLGGVTIQIPELELLFLDKFFGKEAYPRPEGYDAEILAQVYKLDREKIHNYLTRFSHEKQLEEFREQDEEEITRKSKRQVRAINRYLDKEMGLGVTIDTAISGLNLQMAIAPSDTTIFGINSNYWQALSVEDVGSEGKLTDTASNAIHNVCKSQQMTLQELQQRLQKQHEQIDAVLDKAESVFPPSEAVLDSVGDSNQDKPTHCDHVEGAAAEAYLHDKQNSGNKRIDSYWSNLLAKRDDGTYRNVRCEVYGTEKKQMHVAWMKNKPDITDAAHDGIPKGSLTHKCLYSKPGSPEHAALLRAESLLAQAFLEARTFFPADVSIRKSGIVIEGSTAFGMEKGVQYGIRISHERTDFLLQQIIENPDVEPEEVRDFLKGELVHEMTHSVHEDVMTYGSARDEVASHALQFLALEGNNTILNQQLDKGLRGGSQSKDYYDVAQTAAMKVVFLELSALADKGLCSTPASYRPHHLQESIASIEVESKTEIIHGLSRKILDTSGEDLLQNAQAVEDIPVQDIEGAEALLQQEPLSAGLVSKAAVQQARKEPKKKYFDDSAAEYEYDINGTRVRLIRQHDSGEGVTQERIEKVKELFAKIEEGQEELFESILVNALLEQQRAVKLFGIDPNDAVRSVRLNYECVSKKVMMNNDATPVVYMNVLADHIDFLRQQGATEEQIAIEIAGHIFHEKMHDGSGLKDLLAGRHPLGEMTTITAQTAYYILNRYDGPRSYNPARVESGFGKIHAGKDSLTDCDIATALSAEMLYRNLATRFPEYADDLSHVNHMEAVTEISKRIPPEDFQALQACLKSAIAESANKDSIEAARQRIAASAEKLIADGTSLATAVHDAQNAEEKSKAIDALKTFMKSNFVFTRARRNIASALLGRELSTEEWGAVFYAHHKPGEIDSLTRGQAVVKGLRLMRPVEVQREDGTTEMIQPFSRGEAQLLLDAGIAGTWLGTIWPFGKKHNIQTESAIEEEGEEHIVLGEGDMDWDEDETLDQNEQEDVALEEDENGWVVENNPFTEQQPLTEQQPPRVIRRRSLRSSEVFDGPSISDVLKEQIDPAAYLREHNVRYGALEYSIRDTLRLLVSGYIERPPENVDALIDYLYSVAPEHDSRYPEGHGPRERYLEAVKKELQDGIERLLSKSSMADGSWKTEDVLRAMELQERYNVPVTDIIKRAAAKRFERFARKSPDHAVSYINAFDLPHQVVLDAHKYGPDFPLMAPDVLRELGYENDSEEMRTAAAMFVKIKVFHQKWGEALQAKEDLAMAEPAFENAAQKGLLGVLQDYKNSFALFMEGQKQLGVTVDINDPKVKKAAVKFAELPLLLGRELTSEWIKDMRDVLAYFGINPREEPELWNRIQEKIAGEYEDAIDNAGKEEQVQHFLEQAALMREAYNVEENDLESIIMKKVLDVAFNMNLVRGSPDRACATYNVCNIHNIVPEFLLQDRLAKELRNCLASPDKDKLLINAAEIADTLNLRSTHPDFADLQQHAHTAAKAILAEGKLGIMQKLEAAFNLTELLASDPEISDVVRNGITNRLTLTNFQDAKNIQKRFDTTEDVFHKCAIDAIHANLRKGGSRRAHSLQSEYNLEEALQSDEAKQAARDGFLYLLETDGSMIDSVHSFNSCVLGAKDLHKIVGLSEEDLHTELKKVVLSHLDKGGEMSTKLLGLLKETFSVSPLFTDPEVRKSARSALVSAIAEPEDADFALAQSIIQAAEMTEEDIKACGRAAIAQELSKRFKCNFNHVETIQQKYGLSDDSLASYLEHCCQPLREVVALLEMKTLDDLKAFRIDAHNNQFIEFVLEGDEPIAIDKKDVAAARKLHITLYEAEQIKRAAGDTHDLPSILEKKEYTRLYEALDATEDWNDRQNIAGPYERAVAVFGEGNADAGHRRMLAYIDQPGLSRHDALFAFDHIIKLQEESKLEPSVFYSNILNKVRMSGAHDELRSIAQSINLDFEAIRAEAAKYPNIKALKPLVELYGDRKEIFSSWGALKNYTELASQLEQREAFEKLDALRAGGSKDRLCDFAEILALHKTEGDKVSMSNVLEFVTDPQKFLSRREVHASEQHEHKKPSNYTTMPNLDLTAEDLRDALVEGHMDGLQFFQPLEVRYTIPQAEPKLRDEINRAVGKPSENIQGKAGAPRKLFNQLNAELKKNGLNLVKFLSGEEISPKKRAEVEQALWNLVYDKEFGMSKPKDGTTNVVAKINLKSDPYGVLAGNDTACCMSFGSGKNNVYMFNPSAAVFTVQIEKSDGSTRTIAQSLLTRDKNIHANVADIMAELQKKGAHIADIIPEEALHGGPDVLAADNAEVNRNYLTPQYKQLIEKVYRDFFTEYMDRYAEEEGLDPSWIPVGKQYSTVFDHLDDRDNTTVPSAPPGYSDKTGRKVYDLTLRSEFGDHLKEVLDKKKPASERSACPAVRGVSYLDYSDTLAVAYIEGKAYADNKTLMVYLHNMENALIAKDINNATKKRPEMSFKHADENGKVRGYLLAYEGKLRNAASGVPNDLKNQRVIYIADLASDKESARAGGSLIKAFVEQYKNEYLARGDMIPLYMEAREQTSYRIVQRQLQRISKEMGIELELEELPTYTEGGDTMHPVMIRPKQ